MKNLKVYLIPVLFSLAGYAAMAADIAVMSIRGDGVFTNDASLMIDGTVVPEETVWTDERCVSWTEKGTFFTIDLGKVFLVRSLTIQLDHNDNYYVGYSASGESYEPLFSIKADEGKLEFGMETVSTDSTDPHYLDGKSFQPVQARYLKLTASDGDEAFAVSEVIVGMEEIPVKGTGEAVEQKDKPAGEPALQPAAVEKVAAEPAKVDSKISVTGYGTFQRAASLLIDGVMVENQTPYDDERCVTWSDAATYFVVDLGDFVKIVNVTIQVDDNDTYLVEYSADGESYAPLFTIKAESGPEESGLQTVSTDPANPAFWKETAFEPVSGRYLKISVANGDDYYSVAEISVQYTGM